MNMKMMSAPASLWRRGRDGVESMIADGPFLVMACGLLSFGASDRARLWVRSAAGDVMPDQIEEALSAWRTSVVARGQ